jgi:diaminohydroxyphosphoribosylaminopyrimidine deaminase/5-amino-6-(5-phosphoribosylamino)uracil reductase
MARALELAREMAGRTSPNPSVGAVVVREGGIVGEGRYEGPGTPHGEAAAIAAAGEAARGATLYVTLEPCCHDGRTPPCTQGISDAGITEVHYAHDDPDARVSGKGRAALEAAGIRVVSGEGEAEARRINEGYIKHRTTGLPFVIAKFAASLDGKIAATSGDSRWVSGPETLAWSHELRTRIDAIMVGSNTIVIDDPQLTARPDGTFSPYQPLRVIVDSRGRTPATAKALFHDLLVVHPTGGSHANWPTLVATTACSSEAWRRQLKDSNFPPELEVLPADDQGHVELPALLRLLAERGVLTLLVEGGGVLLGSFFDQRLVDKVHAVIAPMIIGGAGAPTAVAGRGAARMADALRLRDLSVEQLGSDMLVTGYVGSESREAGGG